MRRSILASIMLLLVGRASAQELGESGFADSGGVKIHFVTAGKGSLVAL